MDKEWMSKNRLSHEYELGVEYFLQFAMKNSNDLDAIPCPCAKCGNIKKKNVETIRAHMYCNGIDLTYHTWIWHGERSTTGKSNNDSDQVGLDEPKYVAEVCVKQHLIVKQDEKPRRKIFEQPKKKHTLSTSVPRSLRMLYCYSMHALQEGKYISVFLEHDVFDDDYELIFHLEDIISLYQLEGISDNCVIGYIWHLYKNMMTDIKKEKFRFVNPHSIPYIETTTRDKKGKLERLNRRASLLADRLNCASVDQLVLVPCNVGHHWILTVIEPYKEVVYLLDSLSHRMHNDDWKYVVEMALRLFNSNKGRKGRKKPVWEIVQAPRQPDDKQCAYYVMRFMRQIIEEAETIERDALRSIFTAAEYSREEIDEVRSELAECIQDHIYE